jgi:hypothetical protein
VPAARVGAALAAIGLVAREASTAATAQAVRYAGGTPGTG